MRIFSRLICFSCFFIICLETVSAQFPTHPSWSAQSNIYEVNVRQYTKEGTFRSFDKHLQRLRTMGVDILWFMPITPIGIEGRKMSASDLGSYYAVRDYTAINPEFGNMKDWVALVKHAHALGFKVIIDWVANHTGTDNVWITRHPDFFKRDFSGNTVYDADYTDTRNLNYANHELRDSMTEAMWYWIKKSNVDGFRCDVADGPPVDFWKDCIASLKKTKNVFMLAESESPALHEAGFDETYNWSAMNAMKDLYTSKINMHQFDSILNLNISRFPKDAYRLYFTSNHDENSWNGTEYEKYGNASKPFAVLSQTMFQSVPLIYSGQEIPNKKRLKFFVKDTLLWGKTTLAPFYKTLLTLRKTNPALAAGAEYKKLITANDVAIFAFLRQQGKHKVAVILNLSPEPQKFTIKDNLIYGSPMNIFLGTKEKVSREHVFSMEPYGFIVYDYDRGSIK